MKRILAIVALLVGVGVVAVDASPVSAAVGQQYNCVYLNQTSTSNTVKCYSLDTSQTNKNGLMRAIVQCTPAINGISWYYGPYVLTGYTSTAYCHSGSTRFLSAQGFL